MITISPPSWLLWCVRLRACLILILWCRFAKDRDLWIFFADISFHFIFWPLKKGGKQRARRPPSSIPPRSLRNKHAHQQSSSHFLLFLWVSLFKFSSTVAISSRSFCSNHSNCNNNKTSVQDEASPSSPFCFLYETKCRCQSS